MAAAQPCRQRRPLLQVTCLKRSTRRSEGTASWAHSSAGAFYRLRDYNHNLLMGSSLVRQADAYAGLLAFV